MEQTLEMKNNKEINQIQCLDQKQKPLGSCCKNMMSKTDECNAATLITDFSEWLYIK